MTRRPKPRRGAVLRVGHPAPRGAEHALDCECGDCTRRHARRAPRAPLPAAEIREASEAGDSDEELAARYRADLSTISKIVRGVTHPAAGGPVRMTGRPGRPACSDRGVVVTLSVELPLELRDRIDAVRGPESRSAWLRRAAAELLRATSAPE